MIGRLSKFAVLAVKASEQIVRLNMIGHGPERTLEHLSCVFDLSLLLIAQPPLEPLIRFACGR